MARSVSMPSRRGISRSSVTTSGFSSSIFFSANSPSMAVPTTSMDPSLSKILESDGSIEVVGTAMDGEFALKKIEELKPDVVTLDLEMPRLDGIETLRAITHSHHVPVIVVSTHTKAGAYSTFKALALGAFDFVAKPKDAAAGHLETIAAELVEKIKVASRVGVVKTRAPLVEIKHPGRKKRTHPPQAPNKIIAIGVSTGGPVALQFLLSQIPADFPGAIL